MSLHLGKFVHSERGKIIMSILLGFGLASLFRKVCKVIIVYLFMLHL